MVRLTCFRESKSVYPALEHRGLETFHSSPTKAVVTASSFESQPKKKATAQPYGNDIILIAICRKVQF